MADEELYVSSPQQQRAWQALCQGRRTGVHAVVDMPPEVTAQAVLEASKAVVLRHEALRTRLVARPGYQTPGQAIDVPVDRVVRAVPGLGGDWRPDAGSNAELLVVDTVPVRFECRLPGSVGDLASVGLVVQEMIDATENSVGAHERDEPVQYADVSDWFAESVSAAGGFWTAEKRAADGSEPRLPFEGHGRGCGRTTEERELSFPDCDDPEASLLTAFQVVLSRATVETTPTIGVVSPGRGHEDLVSVVGPVARSLPLRQRPDHDGAFATNVRTTRRSLARLRAHETEHDEARAQDRVRFEWCEAPHLSGGSIRLEVLADECPIILTGVRSGSCVTVHLSTDDALIPDVYAGALLDQIVHVWQEGSDRPGRRVVELGRPVLEANRPIEDEAVAEDVFVRFLRQVARRPDAPALIGCDGAVTSYAELRRAGERVTAMLEERGCRVGDVVALSAGRAPEHVVAMVGVMGTGCAVAPVDLRAARCRGQDLLDHLGPRCLLTANGRTAGPSLPAVEVASLAAPEDGTAPAEPVGVHPDQLAYVVHTSGSTGRAKPVGVTRAGLAARVGWSVDAYPMEETDRVLWEADPCFDFTQWEVWATLAAGGCLVLPNEGGARDPGVLVSTAARHGVTVLHASPHLLTALVDEPGWTDLAAVRVLLVGGDVASPVTLDRVRATLGCAVFNQYGPTETTIDATCWRMDIELAGRPAPIGAPIAGSTTAVLDDVGNRCPVGVAGVLYVSGPLVARGYLGWPGATAAAFLPNADGPPGSRRYRTGDLVRSRGDGLLEFLGRVDDQVQVRGFRVEPGEVEAAVRRLSGVREAAVASVTGPGGAADVRLAAYLVCDPVRTLDEVRSALEAWLPEHMLPSYVVGVDALPTTSRGKLDRAALPSPFDVVATSPYVPPQGPLEEYLAGLWRAGLKVPGNRPVGRDDGFIALGGDSLRTLDLLRRIRADLRITVAFASLVRAGSLGEQAEAVRAATGQPGLAERAAEVWAAVSGLTEEDVTAALTLPASGRMDEGRA